MRPFPQTRRQTSSLPEGMFREQNRGTATAQTYLLLTLWRGGPGTSTTVSAPVPALCLHHPPPFPEAFLQLYGMQTVQPYVGPVKRVALYIVSQS